MRSSSRSIPASAGEAPRVQGRCPIREVDPRERGGSLAGSHGLQPKSGRSPRARGKHHDGEALWGADGSIPASAGEAHKFLLESSAHQVDPRERGGSPNMMRRLAVLVGRSPRARGKRKSTSHGRSPERSIPASAGEAVCNCLQDPMPTVDPRERGGSLLHSGDRRRDEGRSPRARGKRRVVW